MNKTVRLAVQDVGVLLPFEATARTTDTALAKGRLIGPLYGLPITSRTALNHWVTASLV